MSTMKLTRKPIVDEVYHNVAAKDNDFPDWLKAIAEPKAKPGSTFLIASNEYGSRLVPSGYYVIAGPTDIYPCSPDGLKATYELPETPAAGTPSPGGTTTAAPTVEEKTEDGSKEVEG